MKTSKCDYSNGYHEHFGSWMGNDWCWCIEEAKGMGTLIEVEVRNVRTRNGLKLDTKYARTTDLSVPIILLPDGRLIDGNHRLWKAKKEKVKFLPARMLSDEEAEACVVSRPFLVSELRAEAMEWGFDGLTVLDYISQEDDGMWNLLDVEVDGRTWVLWNVNDDWLLSVARDEDDEDAVVYDFDPKTFTVTDFLTGEPGTLPTPVDERLRICDYEEEWS